MKCALAIILPVSILSACASYSSPQGVWSEVEATIKFVDIDSGRPMADSALFIGELVDGHVVVTVVTRTDNEGMLKINGYYCLPLWFTFDRGFVTDDPRKKNYHTLFVKNRSENHFMREKGGPFKDLKFRDSRDRRC